MIDAAVAVRILIQFIGQTIGLHLLRKMRPDVPLPFRMRLYPLPSLIALCGWLFLLGTSDWKVLARRVGVTASGVPVYFIWKSLKGRRFKRDEPCRLPSRGVNPADVDCFVNECSPSPIATPAP